MKKNKINNAGFWKQGEPWVWATGAALATILLMIGLLLGVVVWNGMGVFWPKELVSVELKDGSLKLGEFVQEVSNPTSGKLQVQYKTGNRDLSAGGDFQWLDREDIAGVSVPEDAVALERKEGGNFYGFLVELRMNSLEPQGATLPDRLHDALARVHARYEEEVGARRSQTSRLSQQLQRVQHEILAIDYRKKQLLRSPGQGIGAELSELAAQREKLLATVDSLKAQSDEIVHVQDDLDANLRKNAALFRMADGRQVEIPLLQIVRFYQPNSMGLFAKIRFYLAKIVELLTDDPRESNTEGGLFPAIFGTVMLVFLMTLTSFPLGVLAGIYLREYAKDGWLVRIVRIAVNNLAGIPSIVYGIFGLGFFVYRVGDFLDHLLFPHLADANIAVFNTGGILWASMTLGILTVPVVIVSVEEALGAIPAGVREGSLALGATRFQTLYRVLLPMASPGIMTGFILAMARAAGEVAPLMITGVVKLAPSLPLAWDFPFGFDRKFMHLGFHIYDISCQSPNIEATKPMVYVTTLLLLLIVLAMTSLAIVLRNRMRRRYEIKSI